MGAHEYASAVTDAQAERRPGHPATSARTLTPRGLRTRSRLLDAARRTFAETPFHAVRLTDLTTAAGVSAGTFYTYFDDKESIFREIAAEVLVELSRSTRRDPDREPGDPVGEIAHASRQYFLACLRNIGVIRSMEQLAVSDVRIGRARRETVIGGVKRVEAWIVRLQDAGICDDEIDAWTTAMVLHTMNVRVAYDHLVQTGDPADVDRLVDAVTHVWARAVGLERATTG